MKTVFFLTILLAATFTIINCSDKTADSSTTEKVELTLTDQAMVQKSNNFGYELFQKMHDDAPDAELFISPLSVAIALGMAYNGAAGDTRDSIGAVLGLDGLTEDEINQSYRNLIDYMTTLDPKVIMEIANSNWMREGWKFKDKFLKLNRESFDAEIQNVDFSDPATLGIINDWVALKTHDKILTILDELDPLTVSVLINAIYFKGDWTYQFEPDSTEDGTFYLENSDDSLTVPFMNQMVEINYFENDLFESIDLPYGDGDFVMTIFLPKWGNSVDQIIDQLSAENFESWQSQYRDREVIVRFPKFKMEQKYKLNDVLSAMGMEIAFIDGQADFSNIIEQVNLFISKVIHKTFINVDEEGTEAAAVTAIVIELTSLPPQPKYFNANRPFLFMIRDTESSSQMFMGKVLTPSTE